MSSTACEPITLALTNLLARPEVTTTLCAMVDAHASIEEQIDALVAFAEPGVAADAMAEFRELPRLTATMILQSWALAAGAGKRFEMVSRRPSEPLEFARHKRVRLTVDSEEDVIRVALSHVPGRHAAWYAPTR
ncbi:MAG: hypothetical protein ACRDG3_02660 [Tepidiformaceae bacterium]